MLLDSHLSLRNLKQQRSTYMLDSSDTIMAVIVTQYEINKYMISQCAVRYTCSSCSRYRHSGFGCDYDCEYDDYSCRDSDRLPYCVGCLCKC